MIPVVIYMYYVYIESWCLMYAGYYLFGVFDDFGANPYAFSEFFNSAIGAGADGALFAQGIAPMFWFFLATFIINFVVIYRGLSKGIETFCKWALPMLIVAAFILVVRVLTLPEQPTALAWQRGLAKGLPSEQWDSLRTPLADPKVPASEGVVLIKSALARYFKDHAHDAEKNEVRTLIAPPVGFLETPAGLSVARAEIRSAEVGAMYIAWLEEAKKLLSTEQKIELGRLERKQSRMEVKKINDQAAVAQIDAVARRSYNRYWRLSRCRAWRAICKRLGSPPTW